MLRGIMLLKKRFLYCYSLSDWLMFSLTVFLPNHRDSTHVKLI